MLRVKQNLLQRLRQARTQADLHEFLRFAVQLEHSTLPPYLAALYSLRPGTNMAVASILTSIVREEIMHMTVAANLLVALGGKPSFSAPDIVLSYPGFLPMQVDDEPRIGLQPCSKALIHDTFMRIEQPKEVLPLKLKDGGVSSYPAASGQSPTLGDLYGALLTTLESMQVTWGPASAQVTPETTGTMWFRKTDWFPITSLDDARRAVNVIVSEGEGATNTPADHDGDPAHFYRLGEIYHGSRLVQGTDKSWSYRGADVTFDESQVFPMTPNARADMYPTGTLARQLVDEFNQAYTQVLQGLDTVFGGQPQRLDTVMGLMYQLRIFAYEVLMHPDPNDKTRSTGLTFECVPQD